MVVVVFEEGYYPKKVGATGRMAQFPIYYLHHLAKSDGVGMLWGMESWAHSNARRLEKARRLLKPAVAGLQGIWTDMGCGDGIFTYLLFDCLQPGSEVYAVDKRQAALQQLQQNIGGSLPEAKLHLVRADFTHPLQLPPLQGILLANALHFVRGKASALCQLINLLVPNGRLIVVEYNTHQGNAAVPYPIDERGFLALAREVGLRKPQIVIKVPSSFLGEMYTGMGIAPATERVDKEGADAT